MARSSSDTIDRPDRVRGARTSGHDLTVEQLAGEVGMSVRNIRNHHTRGLLPPPQVRARVGYYNAEHVARLRLIHDLQADGFNLAAIERLLNGSHGLAERLLGLRNAVTAPFEPENPEIISGDELAKRFGEIDAKDTERIRKLRLLVPLGEDRFEVPSPTLLKAAEQVMDLGIPLHAALSLAERVSRNCESISRAFTRLYLRELWQPFQRAGEPDEQWEELIEAVNTLRPLASEALLALFKQTMTTQLEDTFGKVIEHQARRRKST
ncbi:MAG: MerR family transcriptional regulator [Solirubrobacteraceae bacterium]